MSSFPGSPRTLPGAIVAVDPSSLLSRLVVFQYNPDEVTRTLTPRSAPGSGGSGASNTHRLWGAPTETISLSLDLDAADGLETGDPVAVTVGVAGRLAGLEMLLYPSSATIVANSALLLAGTLEILPPDGPLTVLALGPTRVVPVRLTRLVVREQAYSPALVPIRASVDVDLEVLSYDDLSPLDAGYALFLVHQVAQEALATVGAVGAAVSASLSIGG